MKFLFSTGSLWSYSIERCFDFAARAGYDGLEMMIDRRWESRQATYLRRLSDRHSLPIEAVHSPFMPGVPGWPDDQIGRIGHSVELAEALGAGVVVHHPPFRFGNVWLQAGQRFFPLPVPGWNPDARYRRWLDDEYGAFQARTEVRLCIENMPARKVLGRRINAFRWGHHEQFGHFPQLTLDTTHLGTWGVEPAAVYPQLREKIAHVHLSNYDGREHLRPEMGQLRLDRFLAQLVTSDYRGFVSLELHPEALDAGQEDGHIIELMTASLNSCRQWAERAPTMES